jgi:hypothetical protein
MPLQYWVYRIRCSIAHTKIGSHIFVSEDEEFVSSVGEKLIDSIISSVYSNAEFKALVNKSDLIDETLFAE